MSRSLTGTSYLRPPPGHARHGTGSSRKQLERGGSWVLAQTGPEGTS
jgi:hypothetical protein